MTREEAIEFLIDISYELGNMSIKYLSEKAGKKIRKAIKILEQEPCEDAISKEILKEQMIKYGFHAPDMTVTEFVEDLHLQPKTEHWIEHNTPNNTCYYDCSLCGCVAPCTETADSFIWKLSNFCPDCGAKMIKPQEKKIKKNKRKSKGIKDLSELGGGNGIKNLSKLGR